MTASKRRFGRKTYLIAGALVILILGGMALRPKATGFEYRTVAVDRGAVVRRVSTVGTIQPVRLIDIGAQVSGQIQELLVDYNSVVKKGDILARLDPTQLEARLRQAEADLAKARANVSVAEAALQSAEVSLADARRTEKRSHELFAKHLVAQSDLDTASVNAQKAEAEVSSKRAGLEQAKADIIQNEAAVTDAKTNLDYAVIRSPVDGVVLSRSVNVGQTLASNFQAPVLFQVAQDLGEMQLEASVDEADIGAVKVGQPVVFSVDAYPDREFDGSVREIRLVATTTSNVVTYTVVISVDNQDHSLLPGMTANANIETANRNDVLRIPNTALRFKPDPALDAMPERGSFPRRNPAAANSSQGETPNPAWQAQAASRAKGHRVWIVGDDGHLKPVPVQLGVSDDQYTEVTGGKLGAGMAVVIGRQAIGTASARAGRNDDAPPPPPGGPR